MIGVACHRGMVDDSSAARAILNPISSPYAPGSSLPLRLQPARRTLAALVFPSRVLSTSKVSRSPFLMLSGSMPDDCSALICRNHRVAHRHLFIEGLLISVGDLLPSARGETKFPEAVFTAAHHGCVPLAPSLLTGIHYQAPPYEVLDCFLFCREVSVCHINILCVVLCLLGLRFRRARADENTTGSYACCRSRRCTLLSIPGSSSITKTSFRSFDIQSGR